MITNNELFIEINFVFVYLDAIYTGRKNFTTECLEFGVTGVWSV